MLEKHLNLLACFYFISATFYLTDFNNAETSSSQDVLKLPESCVGVDITRFT